MLIQKPRLAFFAVTLPSALLLLMGCAHVTNEGMALCGASAQKDAGCAYQPDNGYRYIPNKRGGHTLVILTLSGGGTRAAALAYGTLQALKDLPGVDGEKSLLDDVDIISSVSGGSVTAGWYAERGKAGLSENNALSQFLYSNAQTAIALRGLNPVALTKYAVTDYQRSDVLSDFFSSRLFGDTRFNSVRNLYMDPNAKQPFVILNATDLGHEIGFPFTQNRFDLICSDLDQYRLVDAVVASADFPMVFSPVGLHNYSRGCKAHDQAWDTKGPGAWAGFYHKHYDAPSAAETAEEPPISNGLLSLRLGRHAWDYIDPTTKDDTLHLVDGGLVDNLGVQSTLSIEDHSACRPGIFQRFGEPEAPGYADIKTVLYIVVNARTYDGAGIDNSVYPPSEFSTLLRIINTSLDSTISGSQNYLTAELQATSHLYHSGLDATCLGHPVAKIAKEKEDTPRVPQAFNFAIVSIDFDVIPNRQCRGKFTGLATSWHLKNNEIDSLLDLPKRMLADSKDVKHFYEYEGQSQPAIPAADYASICAKLDR